MLQDSMLINSTNYLSLCAHLFTFRLAIMLLGPQDFCTNEDHLLGETATKLRHLEILGYTVVKVAKFGTASFLVHLCKLAPTVTFQVPHHEFTNVGMDPDAKREYLQKKVFGR